VLFFSIGSLLASVRGGCSAGSLELSDAAGVGSVAVYSREQVGSYDVATVSAKTADDLLRWLKDNGFLVDEGVKPVVESYVRDGWVFAAYKLADKASKERGRAHPLSFTFPTNEAVYPMRLTAVGNGSLELDLYVLGAREAVVEGMTRERTGFVKRPSESPSWYDPDYYGYRRKDDPFVLAVHDEFAAVSEGYEVLTKLTATLTPDQMTRDLAVSWKKTKPFRQVRYTAEAVSQRAGLVGVIAALSFTVALLVYMAVRQWNAARVGRICMSYALVFVFIFCFLMFACLIVPRFDSAFLGMALLFVVCLVGNAWLACQFPNFRLPHLGVWLVPGGGLALLAWGMKGWIVIGAAGLLLLFSDLTLGDTKCCAKPRMIVGFAMLTLLGGAAAFSVVFAVLAPKITGAVAFSGDFIYYSVYDRIDSHMHREDVGRSYDREREALAAVIALPTEDFRSRVESAIEVKSRQDKAVNTYTGEPLREENSPGNYTIECVDGLNRLYHYDINGAKIETH